MSSPYILYGAFVKTYFIYHFDLCYLHIKILQLPTWVSYAVATGSWSTLEGTLGIHCPNMTEVTMHRVTAANPNIILK